MLNYSDSGSGNTLVFLHGLCENKEIWNEFTLPILQDYRVICVDLPGFGQSATMHGPSTLENYAEVFAELIEHLNVNQFILIGHSLGGYIALAYAEKYAANLKGLVLFHSSALADTPDRIENRKKTIEFLKTHGSAAYAPTLVNTLFAPINKPRLEQKINELTHIAATTKAESIIAALEAIMTRPDRTHVLQTLEVPILFIAGKEDAAVTLENVMKQCHIPPYSHMCFLSDTGHMGMFEKPKGSILALKAFVELCESFDSQV